MSFEKIYIMGHKNPDTDSCCAAVAYAEYKKAITGKDNYFPAVTGYPNAKTEAIFKKFKVDIPPIIKDISPTIKDIMNTKPKTVKNRHVLLEALYILQENHLYRIPVIDDNGLYTGMISFFDLSQRFFRSGPNEKKSILLNREINTTINLAARTLKAEKLSLYKEDKLETLLVFVGSISLTGLKEHVDEFGAKKLVIVVGDREDIQFMAVELGIRLLIITGNANISQGLIDIAKRNKTSILRTTYDSATSIRHLKFSVPVEHMLQKDVMVFSHKDKIDKVKEIVFNYYEDDFPVVNYKGKLKGVFKKQDLDKDSMIRLIMVDHNNYDQAVDGAKSVQLLEILDHHHLDMPVTNRPITVLNDVVGCTCTLIAEKYRASGIKPSQPIAGLLMGGILSDTVMFKSPTCTERDIEIVKWLEPISKVSIKEFENEIFKAESLIAKLSPEQVLTEDKKNYNANNYSISVAQIEEFSFKEFNENYEKLLNALRKIRKNENLDLFALMVTNVEAQDSILLVDGKKELIDNLPYERIDENSFSLPGVLSRKKQLIPQLIKTISELPKL